MELRRTYIHKGFTLIEVIIAVVLMAAVAAFGLPLGLDVYRTYSFQSDLNMVISTLEKTRTQAMTNVNQTAHSVHVADISHSSNVTLSGLADVSFAQIEGTTTPGTIIISSSSHPTVTITLNNEGRISW